MTLLTAIRVMELDRTMTAELKLYGSANMGAVRSYVLIVPLLKM